MGKNVFSVPIFFIVFRETLGAVFAWWPDGLRRGAGGEWMSCGHGAGRSNGPVERLK